MRRKQIVLSKNWRNYIDKHPNSKWLVCGVGPSIKEIDLNNYTDHLLIGVNDIESILKPDYLVIVDRIGTFNGERKNTIINTKCEEIFVNNTQFSRELGNFDHQRLINIPLINIRKAPQLSNNKIVFSNNSTFVACDLARIMGGIDIKLIGVDFTDHKSLDNPKQLERINHDYSILNKEFKKRNIKLTNLSKTSKLKL
tara:strand:+ start:120 stop:713 length:594 start_codon:yes stop_codon:yes gene_type:complete